MKLGEGFFDDNGQPFRGQINLSRQNGNPGRVAGDVRPGAVNFMVGAEASPHGLTAFQSDNRWNLGFDRLADGRYGTVQGFSLDPSSQVQTPLFKAQDSAYGRATSGVTAGNQMSRFGGDLVCLDNGTFVSVVEDRARVLNPDGNAVVATIFAPDGAIVKESFLVAPMDGATARDVDIWANVAACRGGFAVRTKTADGNSRAIYFFDNTGQLKGQVDQATSGALFDTARGDGTRLFGHINSPYVYLTGKASNTTIVKVAAFDSRDQTFVAIADVSEGGFTGNFDRANGAVDALNRLTVSWVVQPAGYAQQQVAARVLAFDGIAKKFTPLTASFFPFINSATNEIRSIGMSVAMTTRQICIAAKGEINYANAAGAGAGFTQGGQLLHCVQSSWSGAGSNSRGAGRAVPTLSITRDGGNVSISWAPAIPGFALESSPGLKVDQWVPAGTANPTTVPIGASDTFFRLRK